MNATALILVDLQPAAFGGFGIPALHDPDLLLRNAHPAPLGSRVQRARHSYPALR